MSYAGLLYSGDTTDPARAKFYGDVQEKITNASAQLLFFQLELNRLDDDRLKALASQAPLSRWRAWLAAAARLKTTRWSPRVTLDVTTVTDGPGSRRSFFGASS
mgnify:CR=1 FL=1